MSKSGIELAKALVNNDKVHEKLSYLKARWADEKTFEDINEYALALGSVMPKGVLVDKMNKSPFSATVKIEGLDRSFRLALKSYGSSTSLTLKAV